jgi:VanZ family protein
VHKNLRLGVAVVWTAAIAVLCLVRFDLLPDMGMQKPNSDKYVHAFLHFVFAWTWFGYFRNLMPMTAKARLLLWVLVLSVCYGVLVEWAQEVFTTTRQADAMDVLANFAGASLAVLTLAFFARSRPDRPELN